jgi:carbon storage regulator CsrA
MLVLTREINTGIVLQFPTGETVHLLVVDVRGDGPKKQVRLGLSAPREVTILRTEVAEAEAANREAAQTVAVSTAAIAGLVGMLRDVKAIASVPATSLRPTD